MTKKHLFLNGLALFVCLFLFAGASFAQSQTKAVQVTSSGQWTVPTTLDGNAITVTSVTFEAWGGGGAGGFTTGGHMLIDMQVSGGGGGGAYGKTTISSPAPGEVFDIAIGAGGYNTADDDNSLTCPFACYKNYRQQDGGSTTVKRGANFILEAMGGKTCAGTDNITGADGGAATGAGDLHYPGGKGGNASSCTLAGERSSGSGGGAAGPNGNGGAPTDATCSANSGWKAGGAAGGGLAGVGGEGTSDHNDVLGGKPVGNPGLNYGGGGAGSKTYRGWHSGGAGAPGAVLITYTYVITTPQDVEIADANTTVCAGADFDVTLNITAEGFNLNEATVTTGTATTPSGVTLSNVAKNYTSGKWHVTGTANNITSGTLSATIPVTVTSADGTASDNATVTVNVYGKLDGGVIGVDQAVCNGMNIQTIKGDGTSLVSPYFGDITTARATGGSGSCEYRWYRNTLDLETQSWSGYEIITGVDAENYTPSGEGVFRFQREYVDNVCGTTALATDGGSSNYLIVVTELPFTWDETYSANDTICSNETYTFDLNASTESPFYYGDYFTLVYNHKLRTQVSFNKGATWGNTSSSWGVFDLHPTYTPADYQPGDDIWYRFVHKFNDCDSIPSNAIYKLHIREVADYTDQFEDIDITLWYGACDTNIANLPVPVLDPAPVSIVRTDNLTRVTPDPGEYDVLWKVNDGCSERTFTQKVTVAYPKCGTLEEPYVITDRYGYEYNTIRIGCDCWLAENLRTNATDATYYDNDEANESFGRLYNWNDAVGSFNTEMETKLGTTYIQGVCPMGWAVPTVAQYNTMMDVAGTAEDIKSDDENAWLPDLVGTNTSGFAAMGAGYYAGMQYQRLLGYTDFWTADLIESNSTLAKAMELRPGCDDLLPVNKNKADKLSVRCVRVEPLSYININIAFDMNDDWGDGWNGAYLLAEYGDCSVKMIALDSHNECTIPVPQGYDVTLTWFAGLYDEEVSFTVTNEETSEVIYQAETGDLETTPNATQLTTFHVDGACNPADLQLVNFVLKSMYADGWNGGKLQVDYGTGAMNLTLPRQANLHQDTYTVALPVGAHIILNWIAGTVDSENFFTVEYPDGTVIFNAPTVTAGTMYEFDVVKQ